MTKNPVLEAVPKLVEVLTTLGSEDRSRAMKAAMAVFGEELPKAETQAGETADQTINSNFPARARSWMKQNSISEADVANVFQKTSDGMEVIAAVPGRNKKDQVYSAYVLTGLGELLATGIPAFQDKSARALCESSGCYDSTNHSAYLRDKGNEFVGTKDKGWTLTIPGLKRAAELVKEINQH